MRDFLGCLGILCVVVWNVAFNTGCAAAPKEAASPKPIASETVEMPAPTPADTAAAQQNLSDAWGAYWRTYYARAKATVCKP